MVALKKEREDTQEEIKQINKVMKNNYWKYKLCEENEHFTEKNKKLLEERGPLLVNRISRY